MTKQSQDTFFAATFAAATVAAEQAIAAEIAKRPEGNDMDCGFAWVVVRPANHAFVRWCKKQIELVGGERSPEAHKFGDKHYAGGWCFWEPGRYPGQSIRFHEAGARAFRDVIATSLGINAETGSRLD